MDQVFGTYEKSKDAGTVLTSIVSVITKGLIDNF